MLDFGFVVKTLLLGRFIEGGIEDLFLDGRVYGERLADPLREVGLLRFRTRRLELLEPRLDLTMIAFQQADRVLSTGCRSRSIRASTGLRTPATCTLTLSGHDSSSPLCGDVRRCA